MIHSDTSAPLRDYEYSRVQTVNSSTLPAWNTCPTGEPSAIGLEQPRWPYTVSVTCACVPADGSSFVVTQTFHLPSAHTAVHLQTSGGSRLQQRVLLDPWFRLRTPSLACDKIIIHLSSFIITPHYITLLPAVIERKARQLSLGLQSTNY